MKLSKTNLKRYGAIALWGGVFFSLFSFTLFNELNEDYVQWQLKYIDPVQFTSHLLVIFTALTLLLLPLHPKGFSRAALTLSLVLTLFNGWSHRDSQEIFWISFSLSIIFLWPSLLAVWLSWPSETEDRGSFLGHPIAYLVVAMLTFFLLFTSISG